MKHYLIALFTFAIGAQAQNGNVITVNIENEAARRFLAEVTYTPSDTSMINKYNVSPPDNRQIPNPAVITIPDIDADSLLLTFSDSTDFSEGVHVMGVGKGSREVYVYNLLPQHTYYYKVTTLDDNILADGEIHTEGQLRMINVPGANNIRDLGGWPTIDGKRIKYGKIIRGSELNGQHTVDSAAIAILSDDLDIKSELDLRAFYDEGKDVSAFGFPTSSTGNGSNPTYYYTNDSGQLVSHLTDSWNRIKWRREFNYITTCLNYNRNVYFHCAWGADRTGYLALFIEGVLGVDYSDLVKDYELTSFYTTIHTKNKIDPVIDFIKTCPGETLRDQFENFFVDSLGVNRSNIETFRRIMLEDAKVDPGNNDNPDDDNPTTAITDFNHQGRPLQLSTIVDLRGHHIPGKAARKGIVIVTDSDGRTRKTVR